eukprot:704002-Hanusia_phi.AAC.1
MKHEEMGRDEGGRASEAPGVANGGQAREGGNGRRGKDELLVLSMLRNFLCKDHLLHEVLEDFVRHDLLVNENPTNSHPPPPSPRPLPSMPPSPHILLLLLPLLPLLLFSHDVGPSSSSLRVSLSALRCSACKE